MLRVGFPREHTESFCASVSSPVFSVAVAFISFIVSSNARELDFATPMYDSCTNSNYIWDGEAVGRT